VKRERPLEIAIVAAHHPLEIFGGVESVARAQARELACAGHTVRMVCGTQAPFAGSEVVRDVVDGIPVARIPRYSHERVPGGTRNGRIERVVEYETAGVDVVHVHHAWTLSSGIVRAVAREQPVALTLHDHWLTCPRFFRKSPIAGLECPPVSSPAGGIADDGARTCARCVAGDAGSIDMTALEHALRERSRSLRAEASAAALLVFPTRTHKQQMEPALIGGESGAPATSRSVVIAHGTCSDLSAARNGRERWDGSRPLRVLHAGNRAQVKGTLDLVRAIAALPRGTVELTLAGTEVEPGFDQRLREHARDMPLVIRPRYDARELIELLRRADLAAYPSRATESYGLVVEEALAAGVPAWVSSAGALSETLRSCAAHPDAVPGQVLPAGDAASWTEAFRGLLSFPMMLDRQRSAIAPHARTARDAARELEGLYRGLLATIS
jgi:glycosyltransferase involved in cell wall biosynthesis